MATRKRAGTRTNGRLEEALTSLINNQALLVGHTAGSNDRFSRIDERFARIESELAEIKTILLDHQRILEALPEAILEKIGFVRPK